eukprot:4613722-Amphidinium_carterae.1
MVPAFDEVGKVQAEQKKGGGISTLIFHIARWSLGNLGGKLHSVVSEFFGGRVCEPQALRGQALSLERFAGSIVGLAAPVGL